jgi:hypothetical protein
MLTETGSGEKFQVQVKTLFRGLELSKNSPVVLTAKTSLHLISN